MVRCRDDVIDRLDRGPRFPNSPFFCEGSLLPDNQVQKGNPEAKKAKGYYPSSIP